MAEPAAPVTFTFDLEEHRDDGRGGRYAENTERLLAFFAVHDIRATVFVVGELALAEPHLLRRIDAAGHELALHSWSHTPLTVDEPARFGARLERCRKFVEDLTAKPVQGFRAPIFSLTPASRWVLDILTEQGFTYSSSVLPGHHPLFGYAGAPRRPFRWPCGLLELPAPAVDCWGIAIPFLGGIYLRYLPRTLVAYWLRRLPPTTLPWSYVHPYDVDSRESYYRFPGTSSWMSVALWRRRRTTCARLAALLTAAGNRSAPPLAELVASGRYADAPYFSAVATVSPLPARAGVNDHQVPVD